MSGAADVVPLDLGDHARVLALNNVHAVETSFLAAAALADLVAQSAFALRIGEDAFVIALDERADYGSPNFRWFRDRYDRFVYVDRIVVAPAARGRGLARTLYAAVFSGAAETGRSRVVCEVNSEPPNPASEAFHAALDFREVGAASLANGKRVRYLLRDLAGTGGRAA